MTNPTLFLPPTGNGFVAQPVDDTPPQGIEYEFGERPDTATPTPDTGLTCEVCGIDIAHRYTGKGRKPKYCELHSTAAGRGGSTTATPASSGRLSRDDKLAASLREMMGGLGLAISMIEPYDGLVIVDRTPKTVDALVALAQDNAQVRKVLEQMVTASVWSQVTMALAGVAIPIAAHHGLVPMNPANVETAFLSDKCREQLSMIQGRRKPTQAEQQEMPQQFVPHIVPDGPKLDGFGKPLVDETVAEPQGEVQLDAFGKPL